RSTLTARVPRHHKTLTPDVEVRLGTMRLWRLLARPRRRTILLDCDTTRNNLEVGDEEADAFSKKPTRIHARRGGDRRRHRRHPRRHRHGWVSTLQSSRANERSDVDDHAHSLGPA